MLKTLIILTLSVFSSISSFSQIDINTLNEMDKKIVKTFKDIYVEKTFKDPYSFKLLKLETTPVKLGEGLEKNILFLKSQFEKKDFKFLKETTILDLLKTSEENYLKQNDSTKNLIMMYEVKLDCYGTNSYGGQILGRYSFNYSLIDPNLTPTDYYEKPSRFLVREIK